jgi:sugar phosphate isomerase/epimerase
MLRRIGLVVGLMALGLSLVGAAPPAAPAPAPAIEEAFRQLTAYQFGQSRAALSTIAAALRDSQSNASERAALVSRLTAVLPSDATADAKRFVCRQLGLYGGAASVPALAALLLDTDLADMARYALERIPDASAVAAMRAALPKASGRIKAGLINSLAVRGDAESAATISTYVRDKDPMIASAAAAAVAKLGTGRKTAAGTKPATGTPAASPEAALQEADKWLADGKKDEAAAAYEHLFRAAESKAIQSAALRGLVAARGQKAMPVVTEILSGADTQMQATALQSLRQVEAPGVVKALADLLPKCPAAAQALILADLATRADPAALPAVVVAGKSPDAIVRLAAIQAMAKFGDASALPVLVQAAATAGGSEQDEARRALDRLPDADVNAALIALAEKGDAAGRREAIRSLGARRAAAALPAILKAAEDADQGVRLVSLQAIGLLADEKSAAAVVALLVKAGSGAERTMAETALAGIGGRAANKDACADPILAAMAGADGPAKCALVRALSRTGGAKALGAVRAATSSTDADVQDAAVRALAAWPDTSAAPDLLSWAKGAANPKHQVLALQGYIRLAGLNRSATDRLKMYEEALAAAKRPDEKKMILAGLTDLGTPHALRVATACLDDETVRPEATAAVLRMAKDLGKDADDIVRAAMKKVLAVSTDTAARQQAEEILKQVGGAATAPVILKAPLPTGDRQAVPHGAAHNAAATKKGGESVAEKMGWQLGCQAYSFNHFTFYEAVEKTASLGLGYIEAYPGQKLSKDNSPPGNFDEGMSEAVQAQVKKKLAAAGVRLVNYGVVGMPGDEAGCRKVFDFAKKMGIETIVSEPDEQTFTLLDKLTEEYKINVAIHNHPKASHYWNPDIVLKACEGHSKRIGACADTGHWVRSGLGPLECLKKLQGRIISLHFKDLRDGHDVPWGTGASGARAMLAELRRQGFRGVFSIEYEYNWDNSMPEIAKCVEFFNTAAGELLKAAPGKAAADRGGASGERP